jgi:hypothetical protein
MTVQEEIAKEIGEMKKLIFEVKDDITEMISIMKDLVDPDECDIDHHGNCQSHGWTVGEGDNKECPQKRVKEFLKKQNIKL